MPLAVLSPLLGLALTPLKFANWRECLCFFPDQDQALRTLFGLKFGEPIGYIGPRFLHIEENRPFDKVDDKAVEAMLEAGMRKKVLLGPYDVPPTEHFRANPMFSIPKGSKRRIIHNYSAPRGFSVNDFIDLRYFTLALEKLDTAVGLILQAGPGALLMRKDWSEAYRNIPISPLDYELCGMKFRGQYFMDTRLGFGLASAPGIFCRYSDQLEWIFRFVYFIRFVTHYFDDYLLVSPPNGVGPPEQQIEQVSKRADQACEDLGVPLNPAKELGPSTCLSYVGVELDTVEMCARLTREKMERVLREVNALLQLTWARVRLIQEFLGLLNWVCTVVRAGRPFMSRCFKLIGYAEKHKVNVVKLGREFRLDLLWWKRFLREYNGRSFFLELQWLNAEDMELEVDASGFGAGGFWNERWFAFEFDEDLRSASIAVRELLAVILACIAWGKYWAGKKITFRSDNRSVEAVVNKRRAKNEAMMRWIRELFLLEAIHSFEIRVRWIPGVTNVLADHLSRGREVEFKHEFYQRFGKWPRLFQSSVRLPSFTPNL